VGKRLLVGSQPLAGLDPPPRGWGGVHLKKGHGDDVGAGSPTATGSAGVGIPVGSPGATAGPVKAVANRFEWASRNHNPCRWVDGEHRLLAGRRKGTGSDLHQGAALLHYLQESAYFVSAHVDSDISQQEPWLGLG